MTNYIIERRAVDSQIWNQLSSTVKQTTYRATKLVAFKEYVFRVYAENQFGVGAPAEHAPITAKYSFGTLFNAVFAYFNRLFNRFLPNIWPAL